MSPTMLLILSLAVSLGFVAYLYNDLVRKKTLMKEGWSNIDVQLKRRADLVPALVEVVKGYASHERGVLEKVAEMRSGASKAATLDERSKAEGLLTAALGQLFAVVENYPQLKADKNFQDLQKQLTDIEDQIQYARRYYNATVRDLNTKIEIFPSNLVASLFTFSQGKFFELDNPSDKAVPHMDL